MAYHFLCITRAPRAVIVEKMLPDTEAAVQKVEAYKGKPAEYEGGSGGFWDDYCLAHFLNAVCLRYTAYAVRFSLSYPASPFVSLLRVDCMTDG